MNDSAKTSLVLKCFIVALLALAAGFYFNLWARPVPPPENPLVDPSFISTATVRTSYAELSATNGDLSDFDCYACHEENKPVPLRFDANQNLIVPKEHPDIVMGHGRNNRNNICTNCHDENNLLRFQTRDGRVLTFAQSTQLCGSCHGPTYRDWEAGAHGRTSGYWNRSMGPISRKDCVSCHNPHSPKFPGRQPAPPPHPLHPLAKPDISTEGEH